MVCISSCSAMLHIAYTHTSRAYLPARASLEIIRATQPQDVRADHRQSVHECSHS